jgi:hypothetical protein
MRDLLQDRAYSETWFALCPRLAQVVHVVSMTIPVDFGPAEDDSGNLAPGAAATAPEATPPDAAESSRRRLLSTSNVREHNLLQRVAHAAGPDGHTVQSVDMKI